MEKYSPIKKTFSWAETLNNIAFYCFTKLTTGRGVYLPAVDQNAKKYMNEEIEKARINNYLC